MSEIENTQQQEVQEDGLNLKSIWLLIISNWKWIAISVIACLLLGAYYVKKQPKLYVRSAIVLIKDETNQQGISDLSSVFSNMGYNMGGTNVNNELYNIQAPSVLLEAGRRLGLDMNYIVPGTFHDYELYGKTLPVTVRFMGLNDDEMASLKLELSANGKIKMSEFSRDGEIVGEDQTVEGNVNQVINTPAGKVIVKPTNYFGSFVAEDNLPITVFRSTLYNMTTAMQSCLSVALADKQSSDLNISYTDAIPERATDVINTVISVYKEQWVKDKNQVISATSKFINNRIAIIEKELGGLDANISSYRSSHLIPDEQATADLYMQQSKDANKQMIDLSTQRAMATYVRGMLFRSTKNHYQLLPANSGIDNQAIEKQISTYNTMLMQRNQLVANSSTKNPIVEDYDEQLAAMRKSLLAGIDNLVAGINAQVGQAQLEENKTKQRIAQAPGQAEYLQSVGRQQKVKEQLYIFLLQKREENELSQAFTAYNVRVISAPFGSNRPVSPKSKQIMIIALILGLAIPIGILVLLQNMNTRLRNRKDLEGVKIPLVGEVPYGNKTKWYKCLTRKEMDKDKLQLLVEKDKQDVMNESFRVLRTKVDYFIGNDKKKNVILFTSFNPNSGKTFLCMNTAAAMAIKGKKVLIIDSDLRKATMSALVGSPHKGISLYLNNMADNPQELIYKSQKVDNLYVMPVGVMPPNPTELLSNGRMKTLIDELRNQFDIIFLDCPPIEIVADTEIIASYADTTLFVVRAGQLERSMLPELDHIYEQNKYPHMAMILNGTTMSKRYGYGYGYGYGCGYGYGYGSYIKSGKKD